ncbi:MAG TPA: cell division protein SepF [Haloplasmataceae bacterium]
MGKFREKFKKFLGFEEETSLMDRMDEAIQRQKIAATTTKPEDLARELNASYREEYNQPLDMTTSPHAEPQFETVTHTPRDARHERREQFAQIYEELGREASMAREIVIKPRDFSDACTIVERIAEGNVVVMDLEGLPIETCKRVADFVLGAVFVMQGEVEKISGRVFRFWVD